MQVKLAVLFQTITALRLPLTADASSDIEPLQRRGHEGSGVSKRGARPFLEEGECLSDAMGQAIGLQPLSISFLPSRTRSVGLPPRALKCCCRWMAPTLTRVRLSSGNERTYRSRLAVTKSSYLANSSFATNGVANSRSIAVDASRPFVQAQCAYSLH